MVSILSLWLPILLAAVIVFVASSIIHMFLPWHKNDFDRLPAEDDVRNALRPLNIPPGDYYFPYASSSKERQSEEFAKKTEEGPVAFMTVYPNEQIKMGGSLLQWFVYCIIVGLFAAYITGRALAPGAEYLSVFRFAGATAFFCYGIALLQNSIWYKRKWSSTLKSVIDGLVYGLLTAGTFAWLWPN